MGTRDSAQSSDRAALCADPGPASGAGPVGDTQNTVMMKTSHLCLPQVKLHRSSTFGDVDDLEQLPLSLALQESLV